MFGVTASTTDVLNGLFTSTAYLSVQKNLPTEPTHETFRADAFPLHASHARSIACAVETGS